MSYPIRYSVDYIERHNRLTTFFRIILAIPLLIWTMLWGLAAFVVVIIAWFAILFTARFPEGMFNFVATYTRFVARSRGYMTLMTDRYPSFGGDHDETYPIRVQFTGPLPVYNRWKTGFRMILALPLAFFVYYVISPLIELVAVGAWFAIMFTGKLPRGLYDLMAFGNSYETRMNGYVDLLTESYPPIREDMMVSAAGTTDGNVSAGQ